MNKLNIAIVGYGHVGECALYAVLEAPDMELAGIVEVPAMVKKMCQLTPEQPSVLGNTRIVENIADLGRVDVAILCCPSRAVHRIAQSTLESGVSTVDSFDIHSEIPAMRRKLGDVARNAGKVSILSAGWDPGIDSVIRGWFEAMAPRGITYTNFGPGMSMGHTCAVKAIEGVADALSITVPAGMGIHERMVYVQLKPGYPFFDVEQRIKDDPYFVKDRTHVFQVEDVHMLRDVSHGVKLERTGVSGLTHNQSFRFQMRINNPALTAQVMVSAARAAAKQEPGCYTMIEIPVIDFLPGDVDSFVQKFV